MKRILGIILLLTVAFFLKGGSGEVYAQMPVKIFVRPTIDPDTADLNYY